MGRCLSEDKTVQQTTLPRVNVKTAGGGYYCKNMQEVLGQNSGIDVCLFFEKAHWIIDNDLTFASNDHVILEKGTIFSINAGTTTFNGTFDNVAMGILSSASGSVYKNNRFDNIGWNGFTHAVYIGGGAENIILERNYINDSAGYGLHIYSATEEIFIDTFHVLLNTVLKIGVYYYLC